MTLIEQIKKDQIQARKSKDKLRIDLLTTLIGEAEMVGKNKGNRVPTNSEVIKTIEKFVKGATQIKDLTKDINVAQKSTDEINILVEYLPQHLTEEQLTAAIDSIILDLNASSMEQMGLVMKELKAAHDGLYDGKHASEIVKQHLSRK